MPITALRKPSTCAWCAAELDGLEALLAHVDEHLDEPNRQHLRPGSHERSVSTRLSVSPVSRCL